MSAKTGKWTRVGHPLGNAGVGGEADGLAGVGVSEGRDWRGRLLGPLGAPGWSRGRSSAQSAAAVRATAAPGPRAPGGWSVPGEVARPAGAPLRQPAPARPAAAPRRAGPASPRPGEVRSEAVHLQQAQLLEQLFVMRLLGQPSGLQAVLLHQAQLLEQLVGVRLPGGLQAILLLPVPLRRQATLLLHFRFRLPLSPTLAHGLAEVVVVARR